MSDHELFTRCPTCKTVYRTNEEQLSVQAGKVRCGQCRMVFDGRAHLTDLAPRHEKQPDEKEAGPPTVMLRSSGHLSPADDDAAPPSHVPGGSASALLAGLSRAAAERPDTDTRATSAVPLTEASDVDAASSVSVPKTMSSAVAAGGVDSGAEVSDAQNFYPADPDATQPGVRFFHRTDAADAASEKVRSDMANAASSADSAIADAASSDAEYAHDAHFDAVPADAVPADAELSDAQPSAAGQSDDEPGDVRASEAETLDAAGVDAAADVAAADAGSVINQSSDVTQESAASALDAPIDGAPVQAVAASDADLVMPAWEEAPVPPRRGVRWAYTIMALLLAATLAGQAIYHFRHSLAAEYPRLRPHLNTACAAIGCVIDPLRNKDDITIESHDLQADPAHQGLLILQTTLRNQSRHSIAFPHLELELNDLGGQPIVRRIFAPMEYAGGAADFTKGMPANAEWNVKIFLDASSVSAGGYNLYLFYP